MKNAIVHLNRNNIQSAPVYVWSILTVLGFSMYMFDFTGWSITLFGSLAGLNAYCLNVFLNKAKTNVIANIFSGFSFLLVILLMSNSHFNFKPALAIYLVVLIPFSISYFFVFKGRLSNFLGFLLPISLLIMYLTYVGVFAGITTFLIP